MSEQTSPVTSIDLRPRFVFDLDVDPDIARRSRMLERHIRRDPEAVIATIGELGETALQGTISIADLDQRQTTLKRNLPDVVTEYFAQRYDMEVSFDPDTERALKIDPTRIALAEEHQKGPDYFRAGKMSSFTRPREDAPSLRNQLRMHRLSFFASRVALWQQQNPRVKVNLDQELPSTG